MYQLTDGNVVIDVENGIIVSQDDASYQDWLSSGGVPLPIPTKYVFGKKGASGWYLGVNALDYSWVQMQSERPEGDYIASETGEWVIREPTYAEALKELNAQFYSDRASLSADLANVQLLDGEHQESRTAALQQDYADLLDQYDADVAALKSQYGE